MLGKLLSISKEDGGLMCMEVSSAGIDVEAGVSWFNDADGDYWNIMHEDGSRLTEEEFLNLMTELASKAIVVANFYIEADDEEE